MAASGAETVPVDISIATRPNAIDTVPGLLEEITAAVAALPSGGNAARQDLLVKCRTLVQALETPRETMTKHCWAQPGVIAALNFGIDAGLWALMVKNGDGPQKVEELASSLGVDAVLLTHVRLGRLMRHLGAMGYIIETSKNEYKSTNYSKAMSLPRFSNGFLALNSCTSAACTSFHDFSRKRGWTNPVDAKDTPLMYACATDKDLFAWLESLGHDSHFNDLMSVYCLGNPPWMGPTMYPVKERLIEGADNDAEAPFLVDIGGNLGHDLNKFRNHHPITPGKLILQDLPVVIAQIKDLDPAIVRMEHDFFTEQPVKGARAYYMHSCLHDWPDSVCEIILGQIKAAMKPGYSKLLVHEKIIPETGADWEITGCDILMLTLLSGLERTLTAWHELLESKAGLKIVKIWNGGKGAESLIECELC